MQSAQTRILSQLEDELSRRGIESAQTQEYSNIGSVYLYRPGESTAFGRVSYDFQGATYALTMQVAGRNIPSQQGRDDYFAFRQGYDQRTRFWEVLDRELKPFVGKPLTPAAAEKEPARKRAGARP